MRVVTKAHRHAEQLAALGHPVRLAILRFVLKGDKGGTAAGEIQSRVDMPASSLRHQLKRSVDAGLLSTRNHGTYRYYAAAYDSLRALTDYLWEDCCKRGKGG